MGIWFQTARAEDAGRGGRRLRRNRPGVETLEEWVLLAPVLSPVLTALTTYRYWVDYAP